MKQTRPVFAFLALLAIATDSAAAEPAQVSSGLDHEIVRGKTGERLDELTSSYSEWGFSGTVLVAQGGEILLHKGYGLANRESGVANSVDTRHPSLSITKPILAMAVMRLAERGVLDLDAPLSTVLGDFPESKQNATLHHLLIHAAGLAKRGSDVGRPERTAFIQAMKDAPLESPPGQERRYSNAGYSLIAAVVEKATGKPWETVVREEIFAPAGMAESTFATDPNAPPTAIGYAGAAYAPRPMTLADGPPELAELWWGAAGAAGVDGTVADLYRWLRAATTGVLISAESAAKIFTAYIDDQGYGWHVDTTGAGTPRRWKGGGLPMYESKVAWYPDQDLFIAFAINNHFGWRVPLWSGLEAILFGGEVDLPPRPVPGPEPELASSYRTSNGGTISVRFDDPWFVVTADNEAAAKDLAFEGDSAESGATLGARAIAPGTLAALRLRPGRSELSWIELNFADIGGEGSGLSLVSVESKQEALVP